jgi:hypothetical protein
MRWLQIKGRVQNGTTPIFKGTGPWRMAICFFGYLDVLNSNLNCGYIKYTSNFLGENIRLEVWNPRNHACH